MGFKSDQYIVLPARNNMRLLALVALCFAAVAAVPSNPQRIIGGSPVPPLPISLYPSIAALLYSWNLSTYSQACGGTIINNRAIVTAAHCTIGDASIRWRIRLGNIQNNIGGFVYNVNLIINHPQYSGNSLDNDIAILRSASIFLFNNNIAPVSISGSNYIIGDNDPVWAVGWGATSAGGPNSDQLHHVELRVINQDICKNNYITFGITITANMLCAGWPDGGRGQCQGDSGGPLYHNGVLVGVCSFGIGCGQLAFPSVNTRVSRYASWIQSNA